MKRLGLQRRRVENFSDQEFRFFHFTVEQKGFVP